MARRASVKRRWSFRGCHYHSRHRRATNHGWWPTELRERWRQTLREIVLIAESARQVIQAIRFIVDTTPEPEIRATQLRSALPPVAGAGIVGTMLGDIATCCSAGVQHRQC